MGKNRSTSTSSGVERSFGEETEITFTEGKATMSSTVNGVMKLYKAEAAHIKVKEGSLNNGAGLAVMVKAAEAKKFSMPTPSEQEAGTSFNVILTATDEWGNTATSYAGKKTIAWSEPANSPNAKAPSYTAIGHLHGRRGRGCLDQTVRRPEHDAESKGRHDRRNHGRLHRQGRRGEEIHRANALRTGSGRRLQRDADRDRRIRQHRDRLRGLKDARVERAGQLAQRHGARIPGTATAVTFTAGVGTASALKLYDAQSTTLKAKEGTIEGTTRLRSPSRRQAPQASACRRRPSRTAGTAFNVT